MWISQIHIHRIVETWGKIDTVEICEFWKHQGCEAREMSVWSLLFRRRKGQEECRARWYFPLSVRTGRKMAGLSSAGSRLHFQALGYEFPVWSWIFSTGSLRVLYPPGRQVCGGGGTLWNSRAWRPLSASHLCKEEQTQNSAKQYPDSVKLSLNLEWPQVFFGKFPSETHFTLGYSETSKYEKA